MDSWEWNKIAGAVLGTLIFVLVLGILADAVYEPHQPAQPGYTVPGVAQTASAPAKPAAPAEEPLPDFAKVIPAASVANGQKVSHYCAQCHDWSKGGPNRIGPNLWNILGSARGEDRGGFAFSSAMKAKGGTWTYAELFRFLKNPQGYISGTKMTFAGVSSVQDRIDLIAYIRTWADSPAPLPAPEAAKPAAAQAAAPAAPQTAALAAAPAATPASPAAGSLPDFAKAIPAASVDEGKKLTNQCAMCHDWTKGGPNRIGPNLWDILGSPRGTDRGGFAFSSAMKAKGGTWTYAELFQFLGNPQAYIPGTKMTFAGFSDPKQRLDVIAYIRTWSDKPVPLPAAK